MRLPSHAWADGQAGRCFPGVLYVHTDGVLPGIGHDRASLDESGSLAQQEVRQSQTGKMAVESCRGKYGRSNAAVQHLMNPAHADSDLMPASLEGEIVG